MNSELLYDVRFCPSFMPHSQLILISVPCRIRLLVDVDDLKEMMLDHASIEKAMRVYKRKGKIYDAEEVAEQYCEFMCLKIMSGDFSAATAKLSPGDKVDSFWHVHLLDTEGYT